MYKEINRKGCVYFIRTPLEKLKFVDKTTLKIGHTTNLDIRFKAVNTFIQDEEDYVENNSLFFVHSSIQAHNGTEIMEGIIHKALSKFKSRKEFFALPLKLNVEGLKKIVKKSLLRHNIKDIEFYTDKNDIPKTKVHITFKERLENNNGILIAREKQIPLVNKTVEFFSKETSGGLYLPCGYGKTFITVLSLLKMKVKKCIIFVPRLIISREWEKCLSLTKIPFIVTNSEHDYSLGDYGEQEFLYVITTYQTFLKK